MRGNNRKEGKGNKDFKKGEGKLGQGVGWGWNPLMNYGKIKHFTEEAD